MCSQENMEGAHVPADPASGLIDILKRADKVQARPLQAPKHLHARKSLVRSACQCAFQAPLPA